MSKRDLLPATRLTKVADTATYERAQGWIRNNVKGIARGNVEASFLSGSTLGRHGGERW